MKKVDIIAALIIGAVSGLIAMFILDFTQWEQFPIFGSYPMSMLFVFPIAALGMVFVASLISKRKPVLFQIAKCFLAGVLNTFIDLGVLNFLMSIFSIVSGPYWAVLKAISFTAGSVNSYFWNKYWTFEKKETKPTKEEFLKLYVITGIGLFLNVGIAYFFVSIVGPQLGFSEKIWANVSAGIATFVVFVWNFAGYKFVVFKK